MADILVVDDERLVRVLSREACTRHGHTVKEAATLAEGLEKAACGVDLVLLDVMLPDGDGLSAVPRFAALPGYPEVVIITGYGHAEGAHFALQAGALDYLCKPLQLCELEHAITHALSWREQRRKRDADIVCSELVGQSRLLRDALSRLAEVAATDVNVLLYGETGVGKELFAQTVHRNSRRCHGPYITLDCASLSATLLEAQLFGHARGAFTGADKAREGLLRAADGGTLFLDEVGELPLEVQSAFLRALDVRRFRPVGEKNEVTSDFRLVAATNRDLNAMVAAGTFRADLLFRLRGSTIVVPPLRRRKEDIPPLMAHVLGKEAQQYQRPPKTADPEFLAAVMEYDWPGNVRELFHALEGACAAAGEGAALRVHHLPQEIRIALSKRRFHAQDMAPVPAPSRQDSHSTALPSLRRCREEAEAAYLDSLLSLCRGDMPQAARMAGVSRGHLYELLRKHQKAPE